MITYQMISMLDNRAKTKLIEMMRRHKIGANSFPAIEDVALTKYDVLMLLRELHPPFEIRENLSAERLWNQLKAVLEGNI